MRSPQNLQKNATCFLMLAEMEWCSKQVDGIDATLGLITTKPFASYRMANAVRLTGKCRSAYWQMQG